MTEPVDPAPDAAEAGGRIVVWQDGGRLSWEHGLPWIVERQLGDGRAHVLAACSEEQTARLLADAFAARDILTKLAGEYRKLVDAERIARDFSAPQGIEWIGHDRAMLTWRAAAEMAERAKEGA